MSPTRILHVIDDKKFISSCRQTFAVEGVDNIFCTSKELNDRLKIMDFDVVIVHFLRTPVARALYKNKPEVPMVWFFWGDDAFGLGKFHNTFLSAKSRKARLSIAFQSGIINGLKALIKDMLPYTVDKSSTMEIKRKVMPLFDIIVPIIPQDFELLQKQYPVEAKMFHLNYISPSIQHTGLNSTAGQNILLGNSASFSNNHFEVIDLLSQMDIENRKVIIPLSYGNKTYAKRVSSYANDKLGHLAHPILDFLPFEQYAELLSSCNVLVLNHYRQQAMGNIVHGFMNGMRVCLSSKSPVYTFLNEKGFYVTSVDEAPLNLTTLPEYEQEVNRKLCMEHFGAERQHKRVRKLLSLVKEIAEK